MVYATILVKYFSKDLQVALNEKLRELQAEGFTIRHIEFTLSHTPDADGELMGVCITYESRRAGEPCALVGVSGAAAGHVVSIEGGLMWISR